MLRKKIRESLTIRIFLITAVILFSASAVTFGLIAWVTPVTYTAVMSSDLMRQTENLVKQLKEVTLEESGAVIDSFIRSAGADAAVTDRYGMPVDTGSSLSVVPVYEEESGTEIAAVIAEAPGGSGADGTVSVTMSEQSAVMADVQFAGSEERYVLHVTPRVQAENMAVRALIKMAPWLFVLLLFLSVVCAFVYSRYITRPIVRLSHIAGRLAELDFQWECGEKRQDEIGKLGRSLDQMARRLSGALKELEDANRILRGEVERERELDRQRMAFFSAASHELKTPVTILKGQLSGMLEGVDIYKDRDKYLFRSLQVTGRMEKLIEEMLSIARMEAGAETVKKEPVELSRILEKQAALYSELAAQREQVFKTSLSPGIFVSGDAALLEKAFGNLLSNASLYSPSGAKIRLWCGRLEGVPAVTVENTGARIGEAALPHLFEAFYREDGSRSRSTGGSGLGLYLVRIILERHGGVCEMENTARGVRAVVRFLGRDGQNGSVKSE